MSWPCQETAYLNSPPEKKWLLICQYQQSNQATPGVKTKTPQQEVDFWIGILEGLDGEGQPSITQEQASELEAVIRTSHRGFLDLFVSTGGAESMLHLSDYYSNKTPKTSVEKTKSELLLSCYKPLMNNKTGMEGVLKIKRSMSILALAMDLTDPKNLLSAKEVLFIISVVCFDSEKGRTLIYEAFVECQQRWRERSMYQTLIGAFERTQDAHFKAAVIVFPQHVCELHGQYQGPCGY